MSVQITDADLIDMVRRYYNTKLYADAAAADRDVLQKKAAYDTKQAALETAESALADLIADSGSDIETALAAIPAAIEASDVPEVDVTGLFSDDSISAFAEAVAARQAAAVAAAEARIAYEGAIARATKLNAEAAENTRMYAAAVVSAESSQTSRNARRSTRADAIAADATANAAEVARQEIGV
jgi:hypothetical protein